MALLMAQEKIAASALDMLEMRFDKFLIWNIKLGLRYEQQNKRLGKK